MALFTYNIPTGICILYVAKPLFFFFFFFFIHVHIGIYINVFCPLIKKKKKNSAVSFDVPDFVLWRFLIRWRFSGCRFGVTGRATLFEG